MGNAATSGGFVNGKRINDDVTLFVGGKQHIGGGKAYHGWRELSIVKNLNSIAGGFRLDVIDAFRPKNTEFPLKPGTFVHFHIGDESVSTGYIDKLEASFEPGNKSIKVAGRDLAGDLVDSSVLGPATFTNLDLKSLAEKLVDPFNSSRKFSKIQVLNQVGNLGDIFETFTVKQGETVFEALNRAAMVRGVLMTSTVEGNIAIVRKGSTRAVTELHQGVNVISGSVDFDNTERFNKYVVKGQTGGTDEYFGDDASSPTAEALDNGVERYRPTIVMAETSVDTGKAQDRANWEATTRAAKAAEVNVRVHGWRQQNGQLWVPNQIVRCRLPFLFVDKDLLIVSVNYIKNNSGTLCDMKLMRKDAFEPKPVLPKDDDPLSDILGN